MKLKKGDKAIYLSNVPYKLANGQEVFNQNEELDILSDVEVQENFFKLVEKVVEPKLSESHKKDLDKKDDKKLKDKSKNKNVK